MRTMLDADDGVPVIAREKAQCEGISLGRAVSVYTLRGIYSDEPNFGSRGVPVFTSLQGNQAHTAILDYVERYCDGDE